MSVTFARPRRDTRRPSGTTCGPGPDDRRDADDVRLAQRALAEIIARNRATDATTASTTSREIIGWHDTDQRERGIVLDAGDE
jgi:hypothetical protein